MIPEVQKEISVNFNIIIGILKNPFIELYIQKNRTWKKQDLETLTS